MSQLQDHLAAMKVAPIPLHREAAIERALLLRRKHYTYGAIAKVMGDYHGVWYAEGYWRNLLLRRGAQVTSPQMNRRRNLR